MKAVFLQSFKVKLYCIFHGILDIFTRFSCCNTTIQVRRKS